MLLFNQCISLIWWSDQGKFVYEFIIFLGHFRFIPMYIIIYYNNHDLQAKNIYYSTGSPTTFWGQQYMYIEVDIYWCLVLTLIVIWAKNPICRQIWKFFLLFILIQFFSNNRFKSAKVQSALDNPVIEGGEPVSKKLKYLCINLMLKDTFLKNLNTILSF